MAESTDPVIFVVDDDAQSGGAVAELVGTFGYQVRTFHSTRDFLECVDDVAAEQVGCVITDLRLGGIDGMELLHRLLERPAALPVILCTAYADTALTVRALQRGAVAVLDKPFREDELWSFVQEALARSEEGVRRNRRQRELHERFTRLAPQDRLVLQLLLQGAKNRAMAKHLHISLRTVENRRRRVFDVMQAESIAELTRMVVEYEHKLPPTTPSNQVWLSLPFERV